MLRLLAVMLVALGATAAHAQDAKPTAKDIAAIRACADKNTQNVDAAERNCVLRLVAMPCTRRPQGQSTVGMADCFRVEQMIWDTLLAENIKKLSEDLDDGQKDKLKAMQDAWATSRERTCAFYWDKIQGTMATPLGASCMASETARRALLIRFFQGV